MRPFRPLNLALPVLRSGYSNESLRMLICRSSLKEVPHQPNGRCRILLHYPVPAMGTDVPLCGGRSNPPPPPQREPERFPPTNRQQGNGDFSRRDKCLIVTRVP